MCTSIFSSRLISSKLKNRFFKLMTHQPMDYYLERLTSTIAIKVHSAWYISILDTDHNKMVKDCSTTMFTASEQDRELIMGHDHARTHLLIETSYLHQVRPRERRGQHALQPEGGEEI